MQASNRAIPLTFVVLTYNEENNLVACLESVAGWAQAIFVIDSGSTDRTFEIARQFGATVLVHPFETHAKQWSWALNKLPPSVDWILALDADQAVTAELRQEITELLNGARAGEVAGYFIKRKLIFRGRWIRHGGLYPKYLLKLFRLSRVEINEGDMVDHHFGVRGKTSKLRHDLIEDNQNETSIAFWVDKHNRYASRQAREEVEMSRSLQSPALAGFWRGTPDERVLWLKRVWARLPLYLRPSLYFVYRYVFRLGFLDGKEGFLFHVLQGFWYRLLVDINLDELRRAGSRPDRVSDSEKVRVEKAANT